MHVRDQLTESSTSGRAPFSSIGSKEAFFPPLEEMAALQILGDSPSEMQSKINLRLSDVYMLISLLTSATL